MLVTGEPDDEDVAAAVSARPTVELSKVYVHPDRHGAGVAAALVAATLDEAARRGAASVWLGVNRENARANRFYEKSGFALVGTRRFLVGDRLEDDYVRERVLDRSALGHLEHELAAGVSRLDHPVRLGGFGEVEDPVDVDSDRPRLD